MSSDPQTLVLGWGNPGRLDDGLGPAFAAALSAMHLPGVTVQSDYQLQVEDVSDAASHRRVVFVDADRSGAEPFSVRRIGADESGTSFTTHSVSPSAVLALSRDLFDSLPEAWLVGIRGYEFDEFGEVLSQRARRNLAAALTWVRQALQQDAFREIRSSRHSDHGDAGQSPIEAFAEIDNDPARKSQQTRSSVR